MVKPTTSLAVLLHLGEDEVFGSSLMIKDELTPLNHYKRKTKKLAYSLPVSYPSLLKLWTSPGLQGVKHSREERAIAIGHLDDEPRNQAEHKQDRQEHKDDD